MRLKSYQGLPDTRFGIATIEHRDGSEEGALWLRLPSWGYGYDIVSDDLRWGQRVLLFLGRRGFRMIWRFPSTNPGAL